MKITAKNQGFTLIELIIVIAIIGILAATVIAVFDPLEQRAQAVDTGNYKIAQSLQAAFEQYAISSGLTTLVTTETALRTGTTDASIVTTLKNQNVLKNSFVIPSDVFSLVQDSNNNIIVLFKITSKKFRLSTCPTLGSTADCKFSVPSSGALK